MSASKASGSLVLAGSALVCAVLGSIHAFSVFLEPLEMAFDLGRSIVSLTYSFALATLTLAVLFGPRLYATVRPERLFLAVGVFGAIGAILAGQSNGIIGVWMGYSVLFGAANGLGYGFALQYVARANPSRPGTAMGIVTAAYAFGAAASPALFISALARDGFTAAMVGLAVALLLASLGAYLLTRRADVAYSDTSQSDATKLPSLSAISKIWLAYGTNVAAGLMAIGHAAGIASVAGFTPWVAPAVLAICNLGGSLLAGRLIDRTPHRRILTALPVISVAGLVALALYPPVTIAALGAVGLAYGGSIAAYPAVIASRYPGNIGPRVYGRVFTAWGAAGLFAPWVAGFFFDRTQNYDTALWVAAALAMMSAGMAWGFGQPQSLHETDSA